MTIWTEYYWKIDSNAVHFVMGFVDEEEKRFVLHDACFWIILILFISYFKLWQIAQKQDGP